MKIVLVKYLFLLSATLLSAYLLFSEKSVNTYFLIAILSLILLYLVTDAIEIKNRKQKRLASGILTYNYFTLGYLTKRIIKAGGFAIAMGVLLNAETKVFVLGILSGGILISEIVNLMITYNFGELYLKLEKSIIYISENDKRIPSHHIKDINYRYGIFYLTLKNNKVYLIDSSRFNNDEKDRFKTHFISWIVSNEIAVPQETAELLNISVKN